MMRRRFRSGVASGDVTSSSVVLWTRVEPDPERSDGVEVRWSLHPLDTVGSQVHGSVTAHARNDHAVHVELDGLAPATTYLYTFEIDDERITGRTRTLPDRADSLRIAVACCSRWGWPGFARQAQIVDERPDLLLHLGDAVYEIGENPPDGPPTLPPWDCRTLADYRQRHRQHRSDPSLQHLLANVPMITVWDDHEVADNAPDPGDAERREAGQRAWAEWTPSRRIERVGPLDRHLSVEGLVDLSVVDARFRGRRENEVDGPGTALAAPDALLSSAQWSELEHAVSTSSAPWFVFANQVQVGPMTLAARPAARLPPWRRVVNPDQWDGYPGERDRLYELLQRAGRGRIVLSGDLHSGWARRLTDRHGWHVAHEFTSPSISGISYAAAVRSRLPVPGRWLSRWLRLLNPRIDHLDLWRHGYLVCDITPDRFTTTFVTHDGHRHIESVGLGPNVDR